MDDRDRVKDEQHGVARCGLSEYVHRAARYPSGLPIRSDQRGEHPRFMLISKVPRGTRWR
jgi:hypothetical protein